MSLKLTDHFPILDIELDLACNGGSCEKDSPPPPLKPRLQASSSLIPKIRIRSVVLHQTFEARSLIIFQRKPEFIFT